MAEPRFWMAVAAALFAEANVKAIEVAPSFLWARSAASISNDVALAVAIDATGNVLVTGYFNGSMSFAGSDLVSSGYEDIFLAKFDSNGNPLWVRQAGGVGYDEGRAIATDSGGNIYLTGNFQNTAAFGVNNMTSAGFSDIFIAKYDPNGNLLWVRSAGGTDYDEAHAIAVDSFGNAYITGFFDNTASFGSFSLPNHTSSDNIFVAKCSPSGTFLWAKQAGGDLDDTGEGIALDAANNVYVGGTFSGTATFGSTNVTSSGTSSDAFLAKFDSAGTLLWVRQAGGTNDDACSGIVADAAGNVSITGRFVSPATFGSFNLSGNGADIFVAHYDNAGNCLWTRRAGGNNSIYGDSGLGLAMDASGNTFVTGYFSGTSSFGPTNVLTSGFDDLFCMKYDTAGNVQWVRTAGGSNLDLSYGIAVDASGNALLAGFFASSTISFDGITLTNTGGRDVFLVKLGVGNSVPPWLNISAFNGNALVSWPAAANGSLQWGSGADGPWTTLPNQGSVVGTNRIVTFPLAGSQGFFRLIR